MTGSCRQGFPDHDTCLGRRVRPENPVHPGYNLPIRRKPLVNKLKGIRSAPDIRARALHTKHIPIDGGTAFLSNRPYPLT